MTDMFAALAAPFPADRVSWRVGSVTKDGTKAMALAYIDARDVMGRFDEVCTPSGWERRHPHVEKTTTCEIALWVEGRGWVTKADGAGDTAVEAEKGSLSDSFKRAAVNWGVGRYLYDLPSPWVRIDQYKKILPEEIAKLEALLRRQAPAAVNQAAPEEPTAEPSNAGRKSSAQAKRDKDDEKIKTEISGLDKAGLADFHAHFDEYTATMPRGWLEPIQDMLENRLIEINGAAAVGGDEAAMDEAFRATAGGGSPSRVAERGSAVAA